MAVVPANEVICIVPDRGRAGGGGGFVIAGGLLVVVLAKEFLGRAVEGATPVVLSGIGRVPLATAGEGLKEGTFPTPV